AVRHRYGRDPDMSPHDDSAGALVHDDERPLVHLNVQAFDGGEVLHDSALVVLRHRHSDDAGAYRQRGIPAEHMIDGFRQTKRRSEIRLMQYDRDRFPGSEVNAHFPLYNRSIRNSADVGMILQYCVAGLASKKS